MNARLPAGRTSETRPERCHGLPACPPACLRPPSAVLRSRRDTNTSTNNNNHNHVSTSSHAATYNRPTYTHTPTHTHPICNQSTADHLTNPCATPAHLPYAPRRPEVSECRPEAESAAARPLTESSIVLSYNSPPVIKFFFSSLSLFLLLLFHSSESSFRHGLRGATSYHIISYHIIPHRDCVATTRIGSHVLHFSCFHTSPHLIAAAAAAKSLDSNAKIRCSVLLSHDFFLQTHLFRYPAVSPTPRIPPPESELHHLEVVL